MKRFTLLLLPVFVLAFTATAFAQGGGKPITSGDDRTETMKVSVSGSVDLDYIHRNGELIEFLTPAAGGTAGTGDTNTVEGQVAIRMDADLSNNIHVIVELRNQRVAGGGTFQFGENPEETGVLVSEASVKVSEFMNPAMNLTAGVVPVAFNVRGKGGAMFFDPRWSAPLTTTIGAALNLPQGNDELQPTGAVLHYEREAISLDVYLLPAIDEGASIAEDESAYGAMLYYKLSGGTLKEGSRFGAILGINNSTRGADGHEFDVITLGAGVNLIGLGHEGLELFAEVYLQTGDAGRNAGGDTMDAAGNAIQLGGVFNLQGESKPWVGLKITMFSGDDDLAATDDEEGNFLSYESVSDLMIVEDQYFGVNVRSNYTAIKVHGGASLSMGGMANNLDLGAIIGLVTASEDVTIGADDEDGIGTELDITARYNLNKQTAFTAGIAMLFSSDVLDLITTDDEDSAWLFTVGTDVRW